MRPKQRAEVVDNFCDPAGPRVLILSQVGMVGLNLPIANVLIMVVSVCSCRVVTLPYRSLYAGHIVVRSR